MTESDRAGEPLISVIVPIFNLQDHIGPCIQSLRAQTHTTIQVLLIDDGSTDASASRAREAMGDDPRLTLISQKNEGLSAARNVGLAAAQGEFIAFVDGDDRVAQDYLSALLASLEAHPDMPWAACAIRNCHGDGRITPHSAIFDAPEASMAPGTQRFAFRKASDVIRHYPSAWNKLYRRAFIGDLRFTVGSWFEDHAFYLALALTAPGIVHLAAPLYEQTRGRPGQITETDSDRIFEQLDVLEVILPMVERGPLPGGKRAAARLACRLVAERCTALANPARRAEFLARARATLQAHGIAYEPEPEHGVPLAIALELEGETPLSVIVPWDGRDAPLIATLKALQGQRGIKIAVHVVTDTPREAERARAMVAKCAPVHWPVDWAQVHVSPGRGAGAARAHGLQHVRGRYVAWLDAGDLPGTWAFQKRLEVLLESGAALSVSARSLGPQATPHAGFEEAYTPGPGTMPIPFKATPRQALAADLAISAVVFDRVFLSETKLEPGGGRCHSEWPLVLGALLLADKAIYLPGPDVHINPDMRALGQLGGRRSAISVVRDHAAACAALPPAAVRALPAGWERRLMARALRLWLLEGPERGRIGRISTPAAAAAIVALRGMGNVTRPWPAGFDPSVGAKFSRLFDTIGLLRLIWPSERARFAAGGTLPGEILAPRIDVRGLYAQVPVHALPLSAPGGHVRFAVHFETLPYVNVNFYTGDGQSLALHISLRQKQGCVVVNCTRPGGLWRSETKLDLTLPPKLTLGVVISPRGAVVELDGERILRLGRHRLPLLSAITHIALEGDVTPLDLVPDPVSTDMVLDSRLQLRLPPPLGAQAKLVVEGQDIDIPVLETDYGGRATLPARAWASLEPQEELQLLLTVPGRTDRRFTLSRAALATKIAALLRHGLPMGDADLILQLIEQVALGDLKEHLDADARAELMRLAGRFGLDGLIPGLAARLVPVRASSTFGPEIEDLVARAQRTTMVQVVADPLPPDTAAARHLARLKVEGAVIADAVEALAEAASCAGLCPFPMEEGARDVWVLSSSLPFLWLEGRETDLLAALSGVTGPAEGWRVTPAMAWIGKRALNDDPVIREGTRQSVLSALLGWLEGEAEDYWGRSACVAVIGWMVEAIHHRHGLPVELAERVEAVGLKAYGLNPHFWRALEEAQLSPRMALARASFARLNGAEDMRQKDELLTDLHHLGVGGVARARLELFGPASVPIKRDATLDLPDLLTLEGLQPKAADQAALRHIAAPGSSPVSDAVADLARRAITALTPEQEPSRFLPLQRDLHRKITALLAAPDEAAEAMPALLQDLALMATKETNYLGLGLAMTLLPALAMPQRQVLANWLIARDSRVPQTAEKEEIDTAQLNAETTHWRRRATPVRMGLARLSASSHLPEVAEVCAQYARLAGPADDGRTLRPLPPLPAMGEDTAPLSPHPLNDVIVTVFSCRPYLTTRVPELRKSWLQDLKAMGIPYIFIVGDGDGTLEGDVLYLDAPDDYEGLPAKTLATIDWVRRNTAHSHMFKIDDDCLVDAQALFGDLTWRIWDYLGRMLHRAPGQMDRTWHQEKASSQRGKLELDKSPEPSTYADGGSGYLLSRDAMHAACDAAQTSEGRALIAASFMEDKMLGDLLKLSGITLAARGYMSSVRRRSFGEATPVAYWNVGFYPSRATPTQQVHMDTHLGHDEVRALRGTNRLAPAKIWPSFQAPQLGFQSNALELVSSPASVERARQARLSVVAVMRNEMFMLPTFLRHYRKLGVDSFLIADNISDDGTREFLAQQTDVALFSVDTDYRQSQYGVAWQQAMIAAFRVGRWSLVADADELLTWQIPQRQTLPELLDSADFKGADAARIFMLDMYPKGSLDEVTFQSGDPLAETGFADRVPFTRYPLSHGPYSDQEAWTSALRHRLIPGTRPDLFAAQKIALLRYKYSMQLSAGLHFVTGARLAPRDLIFGHLKYNADFYRKAQSEVARKQHFNDAEEYRKYLALAAEGRAVIHDPDLSLPWDEVPFVRDILKD